MSTPQFSKVTGRLLFDTANGLDHLHTGRFQTKDSNLSKPPKPLVNIDFKEIELKVFTSLKESE